MDGGRGANRDRGGPPGEAGGRAASKSGDLAQLVGTSTRAQTRDGLRIQRCRAHTAGLVRRAHPLPNSCWRTSRVVPGGSRHRAAAPPKAIERRSGEISYVSGAGSTTGRQAAGVHVYERTNRDSKSSARPLKTVFLGPVILNLLVIPFVWAFSPPGCLPRLPCDRCRPVRGPPRQGRSLANAHGGRGV